MTSNRIILIILILSAIIRLINLNQSLWLDEAINVVYAKSNDLIWFITKYPIGDFHPVGWFAILWTWGHLFGWSEISVRIPSVIFGVLTIFLTFLIGKKLFSEKVGLFSALMLCFAPLHIYYSQESRMYSFSALAVTFSFYAFIIFLNRYKFGWLVFLISTIVLLYSDYVAYFILPVQFIYLVIYQRSFLKKYFLIFCIALFFYIPGLFMLPRQIFSGQQTAMFLSGWKEVVGGSSAYELSLLGIKTLVGKVNFNDNLFYLFFIFILGIPYLISLIKIKEIVNKNSLLILLWLILTPLLVWIFSFFIPIFSYFRLVFILPAFYIIVTLLLSKFPKHIFYLILILIILSEIIASSLYLFNDGYHRENWKQASFVSYGQNDAAILFEDDGLLAPYLYYNQFSDNAFPGLIKKPAKSAGDINNLEAKLENYKKVYLFDYLVEITDPQRLVEKVLINLGYKKVRQLDFRGVGFVIVYEI